MAKYSQGDCVIVATAIGPKMGTVLGCHRIGRSVACEVRYYGGGGGTDRHVRLKNMRFCDPTSPKFPPTYYTAKRIEFRGAAGCGCSRKR